MTISEKIEHDLKEAIRNQDKIKISTLRLMKTALKIERNDTALSEQEELSRLFKAAKQRTDSAKTFQEANRNDLADKELAELKIIEEYLPKLMTEEEIKAEVLKAITESNAESMRDIGNVMKILMPILKGKADGKLIQSIVKDSLS